MWRCFAILALDMFKKSLLYKCFPLIFLAQDQRCGFHVWWSLQRIEKATVEKGNNFLLQPS